METNLSDMSARYLYCEQVRLSRHHSLHLCLQLIARQFYQYYVYVNMISFSTHELDMMLTSFSDQYNIYKVVLNRL